MRYKKVNVFIISLLCLVSTAHAQIKWYEPDTVLNKKRMTALIAAETATYGAAMTGLWQLWYKGYDLEPFHFFNDNDEWLQIDKVGHTMTPYYLGKIGYHLMHWTGASEKACIWYGGTAGLWVQTGIEIMDGFSSEWGASTGDMIANITGTTLFVGQQAMFGQQYASLKISFRRSEFAQYRPEQMGDGYVSEFFKDYNGQTYWLSMHLPWLHKKGLPKWLLLSLGYGGTGMTGGTENVRYTVDGDLIPAFNRERQYYLSLDIDLTALAIDRTWYRVLSESFGYLKIPAPTLEYRAGGYFKFHWLYY